MTYASDCSIRLYVSVSYSIIRLLFSRRRTTRECVYFVTPDYPVFAPETLTVTH